MECNYFKDLLFDEINESDLLNIADIVCDDRQDIFIVTMQDIGLSGLTAADGLAVGRPSSFVGRTVCELVAGECTVSDAHLYDYMRGLLETENLFIEPSACACLIGPSRFGSLDDFISRNHLREKLPQAVHIAWATGGSLVPAPEREKYQCTHL